jgi:hydroxymethylpyrimidine kinase/phosphomethylpyrimidine kinase
MKPTLLSIAGFDPSGGAGALLDVQVFESLGFHGAVVLTALTIQNTVEVRRVIPIPARTVSEQYRALDADMKLSGIKVGMLGSRTIAPVLARILAANSEIPRVIDPVLRASSGAALFEKGGVSAFLRAVRGRASLLTPNLDEASVLSGMPVRTPEDMTEAARAIYERTDVPCLVKGGHLEKSAVNILFDGRRTAVFGHEKLARDVHGTGCFLSSAILGHLARGRSLDKACGLAADMVHAAIVRSIMAGKGRRVFRFGSIPPPRFWKGGTRDLPVAPL